MYEPTGVISKRDFHKAMESHKHYTQSETDFLLSCAETDENELLDYEEFVMRFHEPAKVSQNTEHWKNVSLKQLKKTYSNLLQLISFAQVTVLIWLKILSEL